MEKFHSGKIQRQLADIVKMIDSGEADQIIKAEKPQKPGASTEKSESEKTKKDKKKEMKKKKKEIKKKKKEKTLEQKQERIKRKIKLQAKEAKKHDLEKMILERRQKSFLNTSCLTNTSQAKSFLNQAKTLGELSTMSNFGSDRSVCNMPRRNCE